MLKKIAIIANLLAALGLIFVHFSANVNPLDFWLFAFFGLGFPLILALCVLFAVLWLFSENKWLSLISLSAMLITWSSNLTVFQISFPSQSAEEISLMSWNVKNFDLYNWSGNQNTRNEMMAVLEENRPDILCLQEFYTEEKGVFTNLEDIKKKLDYKYHYFAKTFTKSGTRHWGMVIFSKFKIVDMGKLTFVKGTRLNTCIYVDLAISDVQTVRVYNVHFQSNQLSEEDYSYLESLDDNDGTYSAMGILKKLKNGYMKRAEQVLQVQESKNSSPYPSIICGDFNDTPVSFTYKTLSKNMQDAFIEKGNGFGKTYVNPSPLLRIDFALFHPMFRINEYKELDEVVLSDHYPIQVQFSY